MRGFDENSIAVYEGNMKNLVAFIPMESEYFGSTIVQDTLIFSAGTADINYMQNFREEGEIKRILSDSLSDR